MAKRKKKPDYGAELRSEYKRWEHLRDNGGSDPFWTDGVNMNLVRNHILHYRKLIEENVPEGKYPEEYFLDIPPEVNQNYMAHPDQIREKAISGMRSIKENPDYIFLKREEQSQTKQNTQIFNIVRWVNGYQDAISRDDLVLMRRINPDIYAEQLKEARKKYEETQRSEKRELHTGQLTIFDFI